MKRRNFLSGLLAAIALPVTAAQEIKNKMVTGRQRRRQLVDTTFYYQPYSVPLMAPATPMPVIDLSKVTDPKMRASMENILKFSDKIHRVRTDLAAGKLCLPSTL